MGCSLISGSRYEQFQKEGKLLEVTPCAILLMFFFISALREFNKPLCMRLKMLFLFFLMVPYLSWIQGEDLDQAYDSISAFSSRRNNQEAVFGAEESMKEVRLDLHFTHAILYFLFHALREFFTIISLLRKFCQGLSFTSLGTSITVQVS